MNYLTLMANNALKGYIKSIFNTVTDDEGSFFYLLEAVIDYLYINATSKINIPGVNIQPIELSKVLTSTYNDDYDNRVEPSIIGGYKMASEYAKIIGEYISENEDSGDSDSNEDGDSQDGDSNEDGDSQDSGEGNVGVKPPQFISGFNPKHFGDFGVWDGA